MPLYVRLFTDVAHAAAITDLTKLTVKVGSTTTSPDSSGKYTITVSAGTNIEVDVLAPSGNVVLIAIVPSVTAGASASKTVDSTSTAVALIYQQNTGLTISQIESSSAVTNVKNAIETALTDPNNAVSIVSNSTVTSAATTAATTVAQGTCVPSAPSGVTATSGNGQIIVSWDAATDALGYNVYLITDFDPDEPAAGDPCIAAGNCEDLNPGIVDTFNNNADPFDDKMDIGGLGVFPPFTLGGLTNGTTYYIVVKSLGTSGESAPSGAVSATPKAGIASVPSRL